MGAGAVARQVIASTGGVDRLAGLRVHMIGIGGCGMRGAAALLQRCGARITGSDASQVPELGDLVSNGAIVHIGHDAAHLPGKVGLVVISAAIPEDNPELHAARQEGAEVITYAELVGRLMAARRGVSVAGTHGKSTTTALTAYMHRLAGLDPSFIVGAHSPQLGGSSAAGAGEHFIVESCEYARSFLHQRPALAAILNIEAEHLDCYRDLDDIVAAFAEFAGGLSRDGLLMTHHGDAAVLRATQEAACRVETFGFEPGADWRAIDLDVQLGQYSYTVCYQGRHLFRTKSLLPGLHNVSNALAAAALSWHDGVPPGILAEAIRSYEGVARRMALRSVERGVTIVDDYAHHPTEIAATLQAVRSRYEPRRTWVVFQPHQHSRTRLLMEEFARCFAGADEVIVPDIYAVRDSEEERRGVGARDLVARIAEQGASVHYVPTLEEVITRLIEAVTDGDLVVTMGAGDVWKVADELAERVRRAG